jgi:4-amino-4-deoxychorismate lyase
VNSPDGLPDGVWIDGRQAGKVSALDRGLHYGDGLFETIACVNGRPRLLALHLKRLASGCARLALPAPAPDALARELEQAVAGRSRAILKLIVTRGRAAARGYRIAGDEQPSRVLLRYGWEGEDERAAGEGVRVRLGQLQLGENPHLAGLKHLNRLEQVLARYEWSDPAIAESLLFSSGGSLVSGTMSNVFLVHRGVLSTPRLDRCGVAGVMREAVGALAAGHRIEFNRRPLDPEQLHSAEEIFLTNALTGIRPVRELEGRTLSIGPVTRQLQQALSPWLRGQPWPG